MSALLVWSPHLRAQEAEENPDVQAVRQVVKSMAELAQAGDLDALGELYAPGRGVHIIEGAGVNHGWQDYREHHLEPELKEFENFSYKYYGIEPVVRGDVAWASFRYDLSADTPRGHAEVTGRGTAILERRDGRWKVVHIHTSGRRKS
ncbi:MAG: YybH family protein [Gemmatimonadota bacterium]